MNREVSRMRSKENGVSYSSPARGGAGGGAEVAGWEMRPGGMLVQKRLVDSNQNSVVVPTIKVRVEYGSSYHELCISSQANFGELKRMLAGPTGLHHQDQKIIYKDKERDSKVFLDVAGVRNGSKLVLIEDELSRERRYLESRKTAKMEKASKDISAIRFDIDQLVKQVAAVEMEISGGKKVVETVVLNLIEMLMNQLIKLDGISAEGDVKLQRRMQVKRVQKYIENLDMLKIRNSAIGSSEAQRQPHHRIFRQMPNQTHRTVSAERSPRPVVVTTKWETF